MNTEELVPLSIPVPPMLETAFGYPGRLRQSLTQAARYCAFYWEPSGDEAAFQDGQVSAVGMLNNDAFLGFIGHRAVAKQLQSYNLGSWHTEADFWLVLDRQPRTLSVAPVEIARRLLVQQWTASEPPALAVGSSDREHLFLEASDAAAWTTTTSQVSHQAVMQTMQEERRQCEILVTWLDAHILAHERDTYLGTRRLRKNIPFE